MDLENKAISNGDKVISLWKVIASNKLIFFTIYYSILLFYTQYGNRSKYKPLDYIKDILIKYNELVVFVITFCAVVIAILELLASLIYHTGNRERKKAYFSVLNIARRLEEITWILFLIIIPIACKYNTTFNEYWFDAVKVCMPFIFMYILVRFISEKFGLELDL